MVLAEVEATLELKIVFEIAEKKFLVGLRADVPKMANNHSCSSLVGCCNGINF